MNGLFLSISLTIILLTSTIFSTNYFLINIFNIPSILTSILFISIISFILGYVVSIYSSNKNCNRNNKLYAIKMGLKNILYSLIGYLLVYFVSFIREPFLEIFGDKELGYSIAQSFLVVLNTISSTIINYYSSIQVSCKVPQNVINQNLKKLDTYLNNKTIKKKSKKITIKH